MKRALCILVGVLLAPACGARVTLGDLPGDGGLGEELSPTLPADGAPIDAAKPEDDGAAADAGPVPYLPCAGRTCGDACTLCAPGDPSCVETAVSKQCDLDGVCRASAPSCALDAGGAPYIPCAGKVCGSSCTICSPADINCFETAVLKQCNVAGTCSPSPPGC